VLVVELRVRPLVCQASPETGLVTTVKSDRCEVTTMPTRDSRYLVKVKGRDRIEYKDHDRTVVFEAGMLDHAVYLGREKVTAGRLDPGQRGEVIARVYHRLNMVRLMGLEFINPDGSRWQPQAKPTGETAGLESRSYDSARPGRLTRLLRTIMGTGRELP
jgi:hypothetical protein